jgi:hypothetical protein
MASTMPPKGGGRPLDGELGLAVLACVVIWVVTSGLELGFMTKYE